MRRRRVVRNCLNKQSSAFRGFAAKFGASVLYGTDDGEVDKLVVKYRDRIKELLGKG